MTLRAIVAALGGDLYQGGYRANVPAPGHSAGDRSISLLLSDGRVVIHGFGGVDWQAMRDTLRRDGFIDDTGRLTGAGRSALEPARPDHRLRRQTAIALWGGAFAIGPNSPAGRHLYRRAARGGAGVHDLRCHPAAPVSVYRSGGRTRPALVARISDVEDRLTAVELTYLDPNGAPASGLHLTRKTVGLVPRGAAVRLAPAAASMLVGEGVFTTLSAMDRFNLPGWALMAANNLAVWSPPVGVRRVLIAADRGVVGEQAAALLHHRLVASGVVARAVWPDPPFGDWNEAAMHTASKRRSEGGEGRRSGGDGPHRPAEISP